MCTVIVYTVTHVSCTVRSQVASESYPSPLKADEIPAGAVATALPATVPVSPSLAILCPKAGGAVRGLRWLAGMLPI